MAASGLGALAAGVGHELLGLRPGSRERASRALALGSAIEEEEDEGDHRPGGHALE